MKRIVTLLLGASLLLSPVYAHAQESTAEPTPAPEVTPEPPGENPVPFPPVEPTPEVPPIEQTGENFLTWLLKEINAVKTLTIVVLVVAFLKRRPELDAIPANRLSVYVAIIYVILVWISRYAGFSDQFAQGSNFVAGIIGLVLNLGAGAGAVAVGSGLTYEAAKLIKLPFVGQPRPPKAAKAA